jgi:hypothetical protein
MARKNPPPTIEARILAAIRSYLPGAGDRSELRPGRARLTRGNRQHSRLTRRAVPARPRVKASLDLS